MRSNLRVACLEEGLIPPIVLLLVPKEWARRRQATA